MISTDGILDIKQYLKRMFVLRDLGGSLKTRERCDIRKQIVALIDTFSLFCFFFILFFWVKGDDEKNGGRKPVK